MQLFDDLDELKKDEYGSSGVIRLPQGGYRLYVNWNQGSFEFYCHNLDDLCNIQLGIERIRREKWLG
jgi:hypothetical protein